MLRRSPLGVLVSAVIALAVVGFGVSRVVHRVGAAKDRVEHAGGGSSAGPADGDSLIRTGNFAKAIDTVRGRTGAGGEVLELRLEPATAKFQVRKGDGATGYEYKSGGDVDDFGVRLIGPGRVQDNVFPLARLSPATPQRIVDRIHARNPSYSLKDVQFMVLDMDPGSGKFEWSVNIGKPGSGNQYLADLDGSNVREPGDAGRSMADCLSKAGADVAKVQACTK